MRIDIVSRWHFNWKTISHIDVYGNVVATKHHPFSIHPVTLIRFQRPYLLVALHLHLSISQRHDPRRNFFFLLLSIFHDFRFSSIFVSLLCRAIIYWVYNSVMVLPSKKYKIDYTENSYRWIIFSNHPFEYSQWYTQPLLHTHTPLHTHTLTHSCIPIHTPIHTPVNTSTTKWWNNLCNMIDRICVSTNSGME